MLETLIFFAVVAVMFFGAAWAISRYEESQNIQIDLNEGIESAIEPGALEMDRLRREPAAILALRGKVDSITFLQDAEARASQYEQVESIVVDSNGAIHTLEITFHDGFEWPADARSTRSDRGPGPIVEAMRQNYVAERNVEIEENARWLADTLDVPFDMR